MSGRRFSVETIVLLSAGVLFFAIGTAICVLAYRAGQSALEGAPAVALGPALPPANTADIEPAPAPVFVPEPRPADIFAPPRRAPSAARPVASAPPQRPDVAPLALAPSAPLPPSRPIELNPAPPKPTPSPSHTDLAALLPPGSLDQYDHFTAVYDLSAHAVYLPTGQKLEAHSGLGPLKDDPAHVDTPDRGATPPHVYDLTLREELFHGVQALRLNPVGGPEAIFGRAGLLAHTYMLGPNGDSNGCVSFKNYDAFLQAFQSGLIKRLAVVTSLK